jgi:hypothetical protein
MSRPRDPDRIRKDALRLGVEKLKAGCEGCSQGYFAGQPSGKQASVSLSVVGAPSVVPRVTITKVMIDHAVQGQQQDTTSVRRGERATFIVLYRTTSTHPTPTASLRVTRNGKRVGTWRLAGIKIGSQQGFGTTLTLSGAWSPGLYVAQWSVQLSTTTVTRNRAFHVTG